jgi:hypothetical protein
MKYRTMEVYLMLNVGLFVTDIRKMRNPKAIK